MNESSKNITQALTLDSESHQKQQTLKKPTKTYSSTTAPKPRR
jgi:hypothetical protein